MSGAIPSNAIDGKIILNIIGISRFIFFLFTFNLFLQ